MNNPDHISESLETVFWAKIFKFFDADPGSWMEKFGVSAPSFNMCGLVFQFSVSPVCEGCKASPATAALFITSRVAALERALQVSLNASVAGLFLRMRSSLVADEI